MIEYLQSFRRLITYVAGLFVYAVFSMSAVDAFGPGAGLVAFGTALVIFGLVYRRPVRKRNNRTTSVAASATVTPSIQPSRMPYSAVMDEREALISFAITLARRAGQP